MESITFVVVTPRLSNNIRFSQLPFSDGVKPNYCKFGSFRENFIFAKSVKHIWDVNKFRLYISKGYSDCAKSRGFYFHAKFRENKNLIKIFEFTVTMNVKMVGCQLLYIVEKYLNSAKLLKDKHF